ncbi:hypothetical protein OHA25_36730 [Nonomuraea sp. NBC_00507]|uniref:hypothetical protein n=1 Tax=Nonomuraea sp. NBC_00507 TaxID=2976002 RepID=UPI002E176A43
MTDSERGRRAEQAQPVDDPVGDEVGQGTLLGGGPHGRVFVSRALDERNQGHPAADKQKTQRQHDAP